MTQPRRRVAVFTGTRADFGLLRALATSLADADDAELQLIVSGSHLSAAHGETVSEITAGGIPIAASVPIWNGDDTALGAANDFGAAVGLYAQTLSDLQSDIVVVLGDRLEALAMATAATIVAVPVAHVHGGELTEGAMDDALRHAITQLSYLHFVTTDEHRRRVIQLGQEPDRVFNFGAPVLDALGELRLLDAAQIEERFGIHVTDRTVLVTFHPAAFDVMPSIELLREMLSALGRLSGASVIITGVNSDIGSDELRAEIAGYVQRNAATTQYIESFGQLGYLSVMALSGLVVGNSSSTVLEAPLLGVPSVLVGDRQSGRPMSASVLHPSPTADDILAAMERGLSSGFRESAAKQHTPFGEAGFARRTSRQLVAHDLPTPPRKRFYDLPAN